LPNRETHYRPSPFVALSSACHEVAAQRSDVPLDAATVDLSLDHRGEEGIHIDMCDASRGPG
jgi:hypothetical protein